MVVPQNAGSRDAHAHEAVIGDGVRLDEAGDSSRATPAHETIRAHALEEFLSLPADSGTPEFPTAATVPDSTWHLTPPATSATTPPRAQSWPPLVATDESEVPSPACRTVRPPRRSRQVRSAAGARLRRAVGESQEDAGSPVRSSTAAAQAAAVGTAPTAGPMSDVNEVDALLQQVSQLQGTQAAGMPAVVAGTARLSGLMALPVEGAATSRGEPQGSDRAARWVEDAGGYDDESGEEGSDELPLPGVQLLMPSFTC